MTMPGQILATLFQPGGSLGRRIRQQVLGLAPDPNPMRAGAAPALGQGGDIFAGMPGRGLALPNESNLPQKPYGLADVARANVYHAPADSNAGPARNKLRDAITALAYGLAGAEPGTDPGNNVLSGIARGYAGVDAYRHGQEQEAAAKLSQSGREELARQKQASDTDEAAARSDYYRAQAEALLRPRSRPPPTYPIDPRSPEGIAADVQRALELRRRGLDRRAGEADATPKSLTDPAAQNYAQDVAYTLVSGSNGDLKQAFAKVEANPKYKQMMMQGTLTMEHLQAAKNQFDQAQARSDITQMQAQDAKGKAATTQRILQGVMGGAAPAESTGAPGGLTKRPDEDLTSYVQRLKDAGLTREQAAQQLQAQGIQ